MESSVIGWWYKTSDPALKGKSPIEVLSEDRLDDLEQVVTSYFDPAYA